MRVRGSGTEHVALSRRGIQMGFHGDLLAPVSGGFPELRGNGERIQALLPPPVAFWASPMQFIMVKGAQRHDKFVADFLGKAMALRIFEVMGMGRLLATD